MSTDYTDTKPLFAILHRGLALLEADLVDYLTLAAKKRSEPTMNDWPSVRSAMPIAMTE